MYELTSLFRYKINCVRSLRSYSGSSKKLLEFLAKMPKVNTSRITEAQRQRENIKKKSEKYSPSTVYLQVLGSGAEGVPNTLYLFTDQKRYLFNCGECTQRLAHEHKVKLSKLEDIFITDKSWKNIGGLPGLSLTLQDVGVPNITLHGPEGLDDLYTATRRFVIMKEMNVTMAPCSPTADFEDGVMSVKYVYIGPEEDVLPKDLKPAAKKPKLEENEFEQYIHDDIDYYKHRMKGDSKSPTKTERDKAGSSAKKRSDKALINLQRPRNSAVAYICTLKKRLGTLDLAACVSLGVKPGPLLGELKAGRDVVLPDGTLVKADLVKTPDDPGPVFIVMEVLNISHLKESEFSSHFAGGKNPPERVPVVVVHYTAPDVFNHPDYRAFMAKFGPTTKHLVLNEQNSCLGSEAVHRTQHKLHLLDPQIFPLLKDISIPTVWNSQTPSANNTSPVKIKELEELKKKIALAQFQSIIHMEGNGGSGSDVTESTNNGKVEVIAGRTLMMYHLRPKKTVDRSAEPKLHIQDYIQETMDVDGFATSLEQFKRVADNIRYENSNEGEYPRVVFLGTGSCIPSKTRNTSAIVVHVDENSSILLDCGEGTYGQLVRFYGPKKVNAFLRTLKAIYISHLHADHHIGLIGVLQARRRALPPSPPSPLLVLSPGQLVSWLSLYDQQFEPIKDDWTLLPNQALLSTNPDRNSTLTPAILCMLGLSELVTCLVNHCPNAFGVALTVAGRYKITYSGDTIPCNELVEIGKDSTILIHEATMEDELSEEARIKMHSTTSQALEAGRKMGARCTILTHFSQRYARLPRLSAAILQQETRAGIAFDNMQVTMNDLQLLPQLYAPLQLMFAEHCVEMELKAASRAKLKGRNNRHEKQRIDGSKRRSPLKRSQSKSPRRPGSPLRYFETNSSRLRHELKGMTVLGMTKQLRSKSSSPSATKSPTRINLKDVSKASLKQNLKKDSVNRCTDRPRSAFTSTNPKPKQETNSMCVPNVTENTKPTESVAAISSENSDSMIPPCPSPAPTRVQSPARRPRLSRDLGSFVKANSPDRNAEKMPGSNKNSSTFGKVTSSKSQKEDSLSRFKYSTSGIQMNIFNETPGTLHTGLCSEKCSKSEVVPHRVSETVATNKLHTRSPFAKRFAKTYKPQLEDIKSSLYLLDREQPLPRPKTINEDQRKKLLTEAKMKYQTKHFWHSSKYDKIEGLNWVSWK